MWTTARNLANGLATGVSVLTLSVALFALTVGNGVMPALILTLGECAISGSTGC